MRPFRHIGLVGHDKEKKPERLQSFQKSACLGEYLELCHPAGCVRFAIHNETLVQHSVPVEENRTRRFFIGLDAHFTDSHFVCAAFNRGCDTMQCQTTA